MKLRFLFIFSILLIYFFGCATIEKKFRRKKKEKKEEIVIPVEDYQKYIDYHELYKRHYVLWQYWHNELMNSLRASRKKQLGSLRRAYDNLSSLKKYIDDDSKIALLEKYCLRYQELKKTMESKGYKSSVEIAKLRRKLEKLQRLIEKDFRYSEIRSFISSPQLIQIPKEEAGSN